MGNSWLKAHTNSCSGYAEMVYVHDQGDTCDGASNLQCRSFRKKRRGGAQSFDSELRQQQSLFEECSSSSYVQGPQPLAASLPVLALFIVLVASGRASRLRGYYPQK